MESVKKLVLIPALEWERLVKKYNINNDDTAGGEITEVDLPVHIEDDEKKKDEDFSTPLTPNPPPEGEDEEEGAAQGDQGPAAGEPPLPLPPSLRAPQGRGGRGE